MKTIRSQDLSDSPKGLVLDVRTPAEYQEVHIPGSILHPLQDLKPSDINRMADGRNVYVLCKSGNRARQAAEKLSKHGMENVILIEGGITAYEAAGLPLNRGQKTISLERQVRIGAGMLVMVGTVLGIALHPLFHALAGFVGAGLVFAGITDWCGMGMLLARMPWNKGPCDSGSCTLVKSKA